MDRLNNVMSTTLIVFIVSLNNLQEPLYIPISFKHFTLLEAMATINLSNKSCVINDVYTTTEWMNENRHCNNMSVSNNICMFLWLIFSLAFFQWLLEWHKFQRSLFRHITSLTDSRGRKLIIWSLISLGRLSMLNSERGKWSTQSFVWRNRMGIEPMNTLMPG